MHTNIWGVGQYYSSHGLTSTEVKIQRGGHVLFKNSNFSKLNFPGLGALCDAVEEILALRAKDVQR